MTRTVWVHFKSKTEDSQSFSKEVLIEFAEEIFEFEIRSDFGSYFEEFSMKCLRPGIIQL